MFAGSVAAPQSVMLRTSTGIGDGGNECGMGKVVRASTTRTRGERNISRGRESARVA